MPINFLTELIKDIFLETIKPFILKLLNMPSDSDEKTNNKFAFEWNRTEKVFLFLCTILFVCCFYLSDKNNNKNFYTCSTGDLEYSGNVEFQSYTIRYELPVNSIEVEVFPYIETTYTDNSKHLYALETAPSGEKNLSEKSYTLRIRPNGNQCAEVLCNSPNIMSSDFKILFQITEERKNHLSVFFYLYDGNNNFLEISKMEAQNITMCATQNRIKSNILSTPEDIAKEIADNH